MQLAQQTSIINNETIVIEMLYNSPEVIPGSSFLHQHMKTMDRIENGKLQMTEIQIEGRILDIHETRTTTTKDIIPVKRALPTALRVKRTLDIFL